nr:DUF1129 family protein [Eubacterium sp.]
MNKVCRELLKKNNAREERIYKENEDVYTNMIVYLRAADMTEYNQELVRADLIEMILDGQERGEDIQQVMGGCYKEICDEIIEAMPKRTKKEKMLYVLSIALGCAAILGTIQIAKHIFSWITSGRVTSIVEISLGNIISGIVIVFAATCMVNHMCQKAFEEMDQKGRLRAFLFMFIVTFVVISVTVLCNMFLATPSINIHIAVFAIGVVAMWGGGRVLE